MVKKLLLALALLFTPGIAFAQCNGVFGANTVCGSGTTAGFPSPTATPILGVVGGTTGSLGFGGTTSGVVTVQPQAVAGTFNFNLPVTAGSTGQALLSAGGSAAPMTWASLTSVHSLSSNAALAQATTSFMVTGINATEGVVQGVCPHTGTFRNLYLITGTIGGSAQTLTATWRVNGVDSTIVVTIATGSTSGNDTTHSVACTAGQSFSLKVVSSATTGSISFISGGIEYDIP